MLISQSLEILEFSITVYGKAAPSCCNERGVSAIDNAFFFINRLNEWSMSLQPCPDSSWSTVIAQSPLTVAAIEGGEWVGAVPVKCAFRCRLSVPSSHGLQEVKSGLLDCFNLLTEESEHRSARSPAIFFDSPVDEPEGDEVSGLTPVKRVLPGKALECCGTEKYETKTN